MNKENPATAHSADAVFRDPALGNEWRSMEQKQKRMDARWRFVRNQRVWRLRTAMLISRISLRASVVTTLALLILLGVGLVLVAGDIYREASLEHLRSSFADQLRARLGDLRRELETDTQRLTYEARLEPGFLTAVARKQATIIGQYLDRRFEHPVSQRTKLAKLQVIDAGGNVLASSSQGVDVAALNPSACAPWRAPGVARQDGEAFKTPAGICVADKSVYYVTLLPLNDRPDTAYLFVALDVLPRLAAFDGTFGVSVRVSLSDGSLLYRSARWPRPEQAGNFLIADQPFGTLARPMVQIGVAQDNRAFFNKFTEAEYQAGIMAFVGLLSLGVLLGLALRRIAWQPLRALTGHVRKALSDKQHLSEHVVVNGGAELTELSGAFHAMTGRLAELYDSLENLAFTDPLTKLPNRTLFHERLGQAIEDAKRDYKPFALFLLDLDRFKDINDTLGHQAGDKLLQQVAARLRSKLRDTDTVARMGGDEFAVLLPAVSEKHAAMAARMLLQALRAPFLVDEQSLDIGASIGIALYPDHGVDANILIQRADVAMYSAKHANSGHAFYDGKIDQHNPTRLTLLGELRHAVEQEQFVLFYQPKVDLKAYQVTGIEALVRWRHPREDLMLPDTFIPLLEQTGMIRSLTPWVLNEALRQGQKLQDRGVPITVSMNLSVRDLQDPYLADTFAEQLAALQISPRWLEIEITESAVMTEPERALEVLTRLSSMGLRIAIDDFGTGYSSLSYLKKLPVNTIKIDKSFVIGMERDEDDSAIVRTSIDLAHNLKLEVVAEGVENEEALKRLRELGCDTAQGHYISRPLSAEELSTWLEQSTWALKRNPRLVRLHK